MTDWLEFHDSTLTQIVVSATGVELRLDAYIHRWERVNEVWTGTGWMQNLRIVVSDAMPPAAAPSLPVTLRDGWLQIASGPRDGLLRLPLQASGGINIWLQASTADVISLAGSAVRIEATADARYIEQLPEDLRPLDLS